MNDVIKLLQSHRSIRKFSDQPVDQETINSIVACGQAAASSSNGQATTVIQVNDTANRQTLAELAGNQAYVASASAFLVLCADLNRSGIACGKQGGVLTAGMTEQFIIATVDVALFAQNCVIAAESQGLGICYIGALRNKPAEVTALLGLPQNVYPVFGLCIGHPEQDPEIKPRLPLESVLMQDTYDAANITSAIDAYDEHLRAYYRSRTGGKKDSCWSEEMLTLVGKERRAHMREFLSAQGFTMR